MKPPFFASDSKGAVPGNCAATSGRQLRRNKLIGGGMQVFDPCIRAEVQSASLLVSFRRRQVASGCAH